MEKNQDHAKELNKEVRNIPLETRGSGCPSCAHENESGAAFCEECGIALRGAAKCPKCGTATRTNADICEVCGLWLLEGQCMFCYAYVEEGQAFCGECGNPVGGIACSRCGKLSNFDFCKECGIPLSVQAKELVQENAKDPAIQEIASLMEQLAKVHETSSVFESIDKATAGQEEQVKRLKAYRQSIDESAKSKVKTGPKKLFTDNQRQSINKLNEEIGLEEARKRKEAEEQRKREIEQKRQAETRRREEVRMLQAKINEVLHTISGKTFPSSQAARKYFMSLIAGLPEEVKRKILDNKGLGWRCNAYHNLHGSPNDCAEPCQGGVWIIV